MWPPVPPPCWWSSKPGVSALSPPQAWGQQCSTCPPTSAAPASGACSGWPGHSAPIVCMWISPIPRATPRSASTHGPMTGPIWPPSGCCSPSNSLIPITTAANCWWTPTGCCGLAWVMAAAPVTPRTGPRTRRSCWARSCVSIPPHQPVRPIPFHPTIPSPTASRAAPRYGPWGCVIRGDSASTNPPNASLWATWARTIGKKSMRFRCPNQEPTWAGGYARVAMRSTTATAPPVRWSRYTNTATPADARSPEAWCTAARPSRNYAVGTCSATTAKARLVLSRPAPLCGGARHWE